MQIVKHLITYSGGIGSWCAAKRVVEQHGREGVVLLFADVLIEDADLYRFLHEGAKALGLEVTRISCEKTPWQVFREVRFLGNSRVDPCSRILKRELLDKWRKENCDPAIVTVHVGIDWTESHRLDRLRKKLPDWKIEAPMCSAPFMTKQQMLAELDQFGIAPPALYLEGFPHNNCGGGCVKAGHAHFRLLLKMRPHVYAQWEAEEKAMQEFLERTDATILNSRKGGKRVPLSLKEFREQIEVEHKQGLLPLIDAEEWGGCGCALGV